MRISGGRAIPTATGCLESFCVYDTGEDNALRYGHAPVYCTTDTPPEDADVVPMASMDVTSFSYACRDTLAEISRLRGDGRESEWREKADAVAANLKARLWDDKRHACFDRDKHGKTIDVLCHNTLRCMYWGSISQKMAGCVRAPAPAESAGILDAAAPAERCGERPAVPQRAGKQLERAVRGPDVPARDYRLGALRLRTACNKARQKAAGCHHPRRVCVHAAVRSFHGRTIPRGHGVAEVLSRDSDEPFQDSYGPTLLAALEYIAHIWGIALVGDEVWFSLGSGLSYTYAQRFGDDVYEIKSDGRSGTIYKNRIAVGSAPCGVRLVTNRDGKILRTVKIEEGV